MKFDSNYYLEKNVSRDDESTYKRLLDGMIVNQYSIVRNDNAISFNVEIPNEEYINYVLGVTIDDKKNYLFEFQESTTKPIVRINYNGIINIYILYPYNFCYDDKDLIGFYHINYNAFFYNGYKKQGIRETLEYYDGDTVDSIMNNVDIQYNNINLDLIKRLGFLPDYSYEKEDKSFEKYLPDYFLVDEINKSLHSLNYDNIKDICKKLLSEYKKEDNKINLVIKKKV